MVGDHRRIQDYLWQMPRSSRIVRQQAGVPVYRYSTDFDTPPVSVVRPRRDGPPNPGRHIHDFPVLWYLPTGSVYAVAAGAIIEPDRLGSAQDGIGIFFDPAAVGEDARSPWPTWGAHPLLFPFRHGTPGGLLELTVPDERRPLWDNTIDLIDDELSMRRTGFRQAVVAHLTVLLIDVARFADAAAAHLRRSGEPLIADAFAVIERSGGHPLSLRDVAAEVGITPGHLTTVVRRRTGRTVQDWIIERRMADARDLLLTTTIPVAEVAHRVGIADAGYFSRLFRRTHGCSPRAYRAGARAQKRANCAPSTVASEN
jgi:AraC family transcriptional regulator, transcriptional activator of pobA